MESKKLVESSRDGNYFSSDKFRQVHERLVEERQSRLFWKTPEYSQLYSLLLRGSKPSAKVKQSLFHSKDFIAGRIVPHISYIPDEVEEEDSTLYGLLRCWVYGSSVDELYAVKDETKFVQLQSPPEDELQSDESCASHRPNDGVSPSSLKNVTAKQLLEEHLIRWKVYIHCYYWLRFLTSCEKKGCRKDLARRIRTKRMQVSRSLRGQELLERIQITQKK
jgi:hypothetical protein